MQEKFDVMLSQLTNLELDALAQLCKMHKEEEEWHLAGNNGSVIVAIMLEF